MKSAWQAFKNGNVTSKNPQASAGRKLYFEQLELLAYK